MAETRTYQGQTYTRSAPGQPWVLSGPARSVPAPITIGTPKPRDPYEVPQAAANVENTQSTIEDRNRDNARADRAAELAEEKAAREAREWAATHNPDGTPKPVANGKAPPVDPDRPATILVALQNLRELREMAGDTLTAGTLAGQVSGLPVVGGLLGQNRANLEARLKMVQGDLIQQQIARLSAVNGGNGVASIANSETEAARMAAAIANLDPNQSEEELLVGIKRAEDYYTRQLDQMKATSGVIEPAPLKAAGAGATEQSLPIPAAMQAEHMAYLRANWGNLDPQAYAQFRTQLDQKYDFGSRPDEYAASAGPLNERAAMGGTPDSAFIPPVVVPLTESEQANNDSLNSPLGRGFTAYANAAGLGIPGALAPEQLNLMREESSGEMFAGEMAGGFLGAGIAGKLLGASSGLVGGRAAQILSNPITAETAYGTTFGAMDSEDPVMGALMGAGFTLGGSAAGRQIAQRAPILTGLRRPEDALNGGERAVYQMAGDQVDPVSDALLQARDLGVPMTLADASPELQSLAGSAVRYSPTTAGTAREVLAQRNAGQYDRLGAAVERDLGPIENIPQLSEDLMAQAKAKAGPLYDAAYAAPGAEELDIADLLARPSMTRAMANARRIALEEGRNPDELGFVLNDAGEVTVPTAGRYVEARGPQPVTGMGAIHETGALAPADLATFVRQRGGLRDQNGELKFIGADNKARTGVAMAGQDTKFGRLVNNDSGRMFDDMAEAAWEAGYFGPPEVTPRPTVTDFLSALEDTYTGSARRFSTFDEDLVARHADAEENLNLWRNADPDEVVDLGQPVGMDEMPVAPPDAWGAIGPVSPTWQTYDYMKRGLDDVVEGYRDKTTGKLVLDTEGRAVNDTLRTFVDRIDFENPDYQAARAAYAGPVQERGFLRMGEGAINTRPDELGVQMNGLTPEQIGQMRLGYQSELMGRAGQLRNNGNPWAQLNTPNTEGRLNTLYAGSDTADVATLLAQRDLELRLAGSANRLIGNSATAERSVADELFAPRANAANDVGPMIAETAILGAPVVSGLTRLLGRGYRDRAQAKAAAAATQRADELGPILFNAEPAQALDMLTDITTRGQQYDAVLKALLEDAARRGGRTGAVAGAVVGNRMVD